MFPHRKWSSIAVLKPESTSILKPESARSCFTLMEENTLDKTWWISCSRTSIDDTPILDLWTWKTHSSIPIKNLKPPSRILYRDNLSRIEEESDANKTDSMSRKRVVSCAILLNESTLVEGLESGDIEIISVSDAFMIPRSSIHFFQGHTEAITCLFISKKSDGRYLISAAKDCSVCIWDLQTGGRLKTLRYHTTPVMTIVEPWTEGPSRTMQSLLYTIAQDQTVGTISLDDMRLLHVIGGYAPHIISIHWMLSMNFTLLRYEDHTVMVWDTDTGFLERISRISKDAEALLKRCDLSITIETDPFHLDLSRNGTMSGIIMLPKCNPYLEIMMINIRCLIKTREEPSVKQQQSLCPDTDLNRLRKTVLSALILSRGEPLLTETGVEMLRVQKLPDTVGMVLR
jgi:WD40 repeat protein